MIFYGASGHAKVVIESWVASGGTVTAVMDDNEDIKQVLNFPVSRFNAARFPDRPWVISIGHNATRKRLAPTIGAEFGRVIHPSAIVSASSSVGEGTVIMAGVVINAVAAIGNHVIINTGAVVEHDCIVGDYAHVSPNATLCGGVTVGEGAQIGAGATVIPGVSIGKWSVIGAGSVITKNVPDEVIVAGVPGKVMGAYKERKQ